MEVHLSHCGIALGPKPRVRLRFPAVHPFHACALPMPPNDIKCAANAHTGYLAG